MPKHKRTRLIDRLRREYPSVMWRYEYGQWLGTSMDVQREYVVYYESTIIDVEQELFGSQIRMNVYERKLRESRVLLPLQVSMTSLFSSKR
jgi:hypothetical protein